MEGLVRHHRAGGEVVGECDAVEPPRRIVELAGAADDAFEHAAAFGKRKLEGELECAARDIHEFGDQKLAAVTIEAAQCLAHDVDRHDPGDD